MLRSYTNTGTTPKRIIDGKGRIIKIAAGETKTYYDNDSFNPKIDHLISKVDYDANGVVLYIGYASPGTAQGRAGWAIKKRVAGTGLDETYLLAGGHFVLGYRWTERTTLSYS